MQWLVRCTLIWYWRKHSYFKCQLPELHTTDNTEYIVKCVERVLSYNLQHTVDPAQSLRDPLLCVCLWDPRQLAHIISWGPQRGVGPANCYQITVPFLVTPQHPFDTFYHRRSSAVRKGGQFNSPPPILWENCFNIKKPKTKTVRIGTALIR